MGQSQAVAVDAVDMHAIGDRSAIFVSLPTVIASLGWLNVLP
jgi:hypothetical protein